MYGKQWFVWKCVKPNLNFKVFGIAILKMQNLKSCKNPLFL